MGQNVTMSPVQTVSPSSQIKLTSSLVAGPSRNSGEREVAPSKGTQGVLDEYEAQLERERKIAQMRAHLMNARILDRERAEKNSPNGVNFPSEPAPTFGEMGSPMSGQQSEQQMMNTAASAVL